MSYNISTQKIKRLEDFCIPLSSLYEKCKREDWIPNNPELIDAENNVVLIKFGCDQEIQGILNSGIIKVTKIDMYGEGSGSAFEYVLTNAFLDSTGLFECILIWEKGDTIERLTVKNGKISKEIIDL